VGPLDDLIQGRGLGEHADGPLRDHRHTLRAGGFADSVDAAPVLLGAMSRCKASRGNQPVQLKRVHAEAARPLLQGGGVEAGEKAGWAFRRALEPNELGHGLLQQVQTRSTIMATPIACMRNWLARNDRQGA
jgi:hypothetical protein